MINFVKSCGLGNDFVMISHDDGDLIQKMSPKIADRRYGVGCDQIVLLNTKMTHIRFFNADGSEAEACGNGTRCAAAWVLQLRQMDSIAFESKGGALICEKMPDGRIQSSMPTPRVTGTIPLNLQGAIDDTGVGVEIGNPHLVCFTETPDDISIFGEKLENHPSFPNRTNVGFVNVVSSEHIVLRVWERGTGLTLACGSGACAAVMAAQSRGLVEKSVRVTQQGGDLDISLASPEGVLQTGDAKLIYEGRLDPEKFV